MTTTVITGGASGIGFAVAERILHSSSDAKCVLVDLQEGRTAELAERNAGRVNHLRCDVSARDQVVACAGQIAGDEAITGLVNCAGQVRPRTDTLELELDDFRDIVSVHVEGTLWWSQAIGRTWVKAGTPGSIVNVSSVAARFGWPGRLPYGLAKAAIESLTATLAVEWAEYGIRVNAVAPGYIDSPLSSHNASGIPSLANAAPQHALQRVGTVDEVAAAITFLLSDAASFITGESMLVDGGFTKKKT
jgi:glucose 1-dehydrogenase